MPVTKPPEKSSTAVENSVAPVESGSTLVPMLVAGLVLIVVSMIIVMMFV